MRWESTMYGTENAKCLCFRHISIYTLEFNRLKTFTCSSGQRQEAWNWQSYYLLWLWEAPSIHLRELGRVQNQSRMQGTRSQISGQRSWLYSLTLTHWLAGELSLGASATLLPRPLSSSSTSPSIRPLFSAPSPPPKPPSGQSSLRPSLCLHMKREMLVSLGLLPLLARQLVPRNHPHLQRQVRAVNSWVDSFPPLWGTKAGSSVVCRSVDRLCHSTSGLPQQVAFQLQRERCPQGWGHHTIHYSYANIYYHITIIIAINMIYGSVEGWFSATGF